MLAVKYDLVSGLQTILKNLGTQLTDSFSKIVTTTASFFGGFVTIASILVISFYLVVQEEGLKKFLKEITPIEHQSYVINLVERVQKKLGRWLQGQILLSLVVGTLVFIGLWALNIKYAIVLAFLAGMLEIVPVIGPVISAVPAIVIGLTHSFVWGILVLALYIVIQQMENHILVPKIMGKVIGLNPLVIIIALLIGARLAGIMGVILGVPVAAMIAVFVRDFFDGKLEKE